MDGETFRGDLEPDTPNFPVRTVQKLSVEFYRPPGDSLNFVLLTVGTVRPVSAAQGFKPRPKRRRALVSNGYDDKLDDLSEKLDRVSLAVHNIECSLTPTTDKAPTNDVDSNPHRSPFSYVSPSLPQTSVNNDGLGSDLESDAGLASEATFAAKFAQQALDSNHPSDISDEVKSSLHALKDVLNEQEPGPSRPKPTGTHLLPPNSVRYGLRLPPLEMTMAALQKLRETPQLQFCWIMEIETIGQFVEYVMTVYSGTPTTAHLIIVQCGLHPLFMGLAEAEKYPIVKQNLKSQGTLCLANLDQVLASLSFNLPCTFDFILALVMASTNSMLRCRISMAWTYLAAAAQMSLTLGYNRDKPQRSEKKEDRRRRVGLFRILYIFDKMLSMRLNRSSLLRDDDIALSLADFEDSNMDRIFPIGQKWMKMATLYGRIYDDIYSPVALRRPQHIQEITARQLAVELQALYESRDPVEVVMERQMTVLRENGLEAVYEVVMHAEKVSHLAVQTLIYRSIQPSVYTGSAFCDECLSTANECLEEHKKCLSLLRNANASTMELYIHWALLSAPLMPFIVLFCRTFETREPDHLESLLAIVEPLENLPTDLPDAYRKQRQLFRLMYNVAFKYVNGSIASSSSVAQAGYIPDTPFEMVFADAGVPLPSQMQLNHGTQVGHHTEMLAGGIEPGSESFGDTVSVPDRGVELGAWFDQNQEIFRIMDESF
ncbi:unnamed protein product [Clonostachys solani]|uniref:Xylanolytic transcriptional activator regulatory domain-containing protein n=1 Tax=Clonostachys solani TaxID=160281 RepID=A0A9P0EL70_9HYPO|nr:unnamed protein product [Clonostachys solani]